MYALTNPELGQKGLSLFHVKKGTPGFTIGKIENKMGIRAAQVSELVFENCEIPESALIGEECTGFKQAMKALDGGRIGVAAQGLGIAEGAFEIARKYLMTREQFGKPLYRNQHLAFKMAELECEIEQAKYRYTRQLLTNLKDVLTRSLQLKQNWYAPTLLCMLLLKLFKCLAATDI